MRKISLDILRGLAVILVLFRHGDFSDDNVLKHFGWLGVDMFFVLSGYLISNLLFSEYRKRQDIRVKRFLFRRAFKIFPPFYFFMVITLLAYAQQESLDYKWYQYFSEAFYLQSYLPNIWFHTWSLAVEEHFYFSFAFIVVILIRKSVLENKQLIISSLVFLLVLSFTIRFMTSFPNRHEEFFGFTQTHLRSDGILVGILISYLLNFTNTKSLFSRFRWLLLFASVILIVPGFYFEGGSFFMNTAGLSMVNIGFGLLVLFSLSVNGFLETHSLFNKVLLQPIAFIGEKSYSIYLWHFNALKLSALAFSFNSITMHFLYLFLSIGSGIVMWYLIEKPFVYIRDKVTLYNRRKIALRSNVVV
jgi:peptidoglycan/LPS O-acetylase OafA/YrhL